MDSRSRRSCRWRATVGAALLGLFLVATAASGQGMQGRGGSDGRNFNPAVFPPAAHPYGFSYADWQRRDWQLTFGIAFDPEACAFPHDSQVMRLNVSIGSPVVFAGTIPPATSLLIPVLTSAALCPADCGPGLPAPNGTVEELAAYVKAQADLVTVLEVEIDGQPLQNLFAYRFVTGEFSGTAVPGNLFDPFVLGPYGPAVAEGYYVMLHPLPAGEHVIHVLGIMGDPLEPIFVTDTTSFIIVAPTVRVVPRQVNPQRERRSRGERSCSSTGAVLPASRAQRRRGCRRCGVR